MRILCLKVGRSGTQGKEFATLWITTPEPPLSATLALESPLCKNPFEINAMLYYITCYRKPCQRLQLCQQPDELQPWELMHLGERLQEPDVNSFVA